MTLYVERKGHGPNLVMLHGWGLHGRIFNPVIKQLSKHFTLHLVDLPGHGRSDMPEDDYTLQTLATVIGDKLPAGSHWLGWSLGGRVALQAAAMGFSIDKLILVGTTPCFIEKSDWPHALPESELLQLADALQDDYRQTLQRFLAIQSRGSARGREELRALRNELFDHGEPHMAALSGGLEILRRDDLRALLPTVQQNTLILHGERDTLSPLAAAVYSASHLPMATLHTITGAGHAPFISHPNEFSSAVETFLHD